jgi:hypothetical protein
MNLFKNLSYYEFKESVNTDTMYISAYPTNRCDEYKGRLPENYEPVFKDCKIENLKDFLYALKKNNFGISDFIWFLKDIQSTISAQYIVDWMNSLQYSQIVKKGELYEAMIISSIDSSFFKKVYIKGSSLPQEAIDTVVLFTGGMQIMTLIGAKAKSSLIQIQFPDETIEILKVGLFGNIIVGEHLETSEKAMMQKMYDTFEKNGKSHMKLNKKQGSPAVRAIMEETGFIISTEFSAQPYLIGRDNDKGRDPRYWTFGEYGYERNSETTVIAMVFDTDAPKVIPEPLDFEECTKSQIVSFEYALKEFQENGKLAPAFKAHPKLLQMCAKILPEII